MSKPESRNKPEYDLARLEKEYGSLRGSLVQMDQEINHQLAELLFRNVALAFPVQHRVKSWSSILEKLQRAPLSLTSLRDLQDLVGFRIVLQFGRDVERVCSLIETSFKIVDRYDTVKRLKEDQFGYASIHYVVELPVGWLAVPTMAGLADLRAEIQVRTTAQHIWAEASRTLQYKNEESVPPSLGFGFIPCARSGGVNEANVPFVSEVRLGRNLAVCDRQAIARGVPEEHLYC